MLASLLDPVTERDVKPRAVPLGLVVLWLVAFALRAAYAMLAVGYHAPPASDSISYDTVAWNLATGAGFSLVGTGGSYPTAFVPPVVPFGVSLVYRILGHHYGAALLAQCAVGAFLPVILVALGGSLFSIAVGRVAGWIAAFYPLLVFFNGYLLTETTFTVVLCLALLATATWAKTPRPGRALWAGLLCGAATLTRPTAAPLPAVLLLWVWRPLELTLARADRLRQVALFLGACLLCVAPWTLRNALVLHAFVPVTTGGGRALLDSNNPFVLEDPRLHGNATNTQGRPPYADQLRGLGEVENDRRSAQLAWAFLRDHWRDWLRLAFYKQSRFWRVSAERGTTGTWQAEGSPFTALLRAVDPLALSFGVLLPFMAWGAAQALRGPRRWYQSLPLWPVVYFAALATIYWGSLRMRLPAEPLLLLLGAVGVTEAWRYARRRRRP